MPVWTDLFKLFDYSSKRDPLSKKQDSSQFPTSGISSPDALTTDFANGMAPGGIANYRDSYDMIDTSILSNRSTRYKEYERLRAVPEIEMAMTVFADESCISGNTKIATPFGYFTIKELAEKRSDERFLVYCYDFNTKDYTLDWAFAPRLVKKDKTINIVLDNGTVETTTKDHLILKKDGSWCRADTLQFGDELMPFYRIPALQRYNKQRKNQYPRIFSHNRGWIHERQFLDDWKLGSVSPQYEKVNRMARMIGGGIRPASMARLLTIDQKTIKYRFNVQGFSIKEFQMLYKYNSLRRKVLGIEEGIEQEVYDLSVEKNKNFATDNLIMHNCQKDENGNIFKINTANNKVKEELEFLLFHRKMLNMNRNGWKWFKNLCIFGDWFVEIIINPDNPKEGIQGTLALPPEQMYRIETIKGKLIEFQQSKEGPDYDSIKRSSLGSQTDAELRQTTAIRFPPSQIIHFRIGDDRKTFYPYGQSLIETARAPAHSLRLLEDAMCVYRLCVTGDTRVRTERSYEYIKNIKIGDKVFSYDDQGKLFLTDIVWTVNNGIKDVYKVRSQHTEITGTATHPILVNRDGVIKYVEIQDLVPRKDKLINATREEEVQIPINKIIENKRAKLSCKQKDLFFKNCKNVSKLINGTNIEAKIKQFLYHERTLPYEMAVNICNMLKINSDELIICNKYGREVEITQLPEYVDEDFARLFGFLIGDGSIRNKGKNTNTVCFCSSPDEKLNNQYANLLKKYFGKITFQIDKRSKLGIGKYVLNSQFATNLFLKMGYIPGAKNKRIPEWVHTASKSIRRAFVEGISDADGCERYTKAGLWFSTIQLCNKKLVEDIKEVWHSIGLCSGKITHRKRKGGHEIEKDRVMKPTESYHVTITDRILPQYENVWSVTHMGQEEVFDVTVNNDYHNIVSNGIITHQSRAPERRVFYIDVGQLAPFKAEAYIERLKDQFRKRKIATSRGTGANQVEERWQPPAQDEDYWLPVRPNTNTRIDTLPGAENLGEIDDAIYFRNKLLTALNFPKSYMNNEDPGATRITLSAQDVKFARLIERLQSHFEDGLTEIAERHLQLRGFPDESYQDLKIKMTAPSDWRELSRAEVVTARYGNAGTLKSSQLMSDYDIHTKILKYAEDEVDEMLARLKLQKLEDLKLQVLAQNPQLMGVGIPGSETPSQEIGTEPGGPNPMPSPDGQPQPQLNSPEQPQLPSGEPKQNNTQSINIPEPEEDEIKKFDLELQDYEGEIDVSPLDYSIGDN